MLRQLENQEITQIYNQYMTADFPASELKSLKMILDGIKDGAYIAFGYEEEGALRGYAYVITPKKSNIYLLDYLAVLPNLRSFRIGTRLMHELHRLVEQKGVRLMLEVENPDYEEQDERRDYMERRITFYRRNQMKVSNVSCRFYGNEYRILYAGEAMEDAAVQKEIEKVYRAFFGDSFIDRHCIFHI